MEKILLTGASSGIGYSIAEKLTKANYNLICTVRNNEDKIRLENLSTKISCILLDVTDEAAINNLHDILKNENIELIGIINNAGYAATGVMEYPDIDNIKKQLEVNSFAPLKITTKLLPLMKKGKIINISSVSSNFVYPFLSPYCASKRLLDIFFHGLSIELNNKDIKIVSIKPGVIKTPIWDKSIKKAECDFEKIPELGKKKYRPVLENLLSQLEKSIKSGLEPDAVSNLVVKVMKSKTPKGTYNVGFGACIGEFLGNLPVDIQKKLIHLKFLSKFI